MNATKTAWNCPTCRATNVGPTCGCYPITRAQISVDDVELSLPARKSRKRG